LADRLLTGLNQPQRIYNGYIGNWPSARLFRWSAADWSRPATRVAIIGGDLLVGWLDKWTTMVVDLQPGCFADRLLTGLNRSRWNL
jgi:hypothetical protein